MKKFQRKKGKFEENSVHGGSAGRTPEIGESIMRGTVEVTFLELFTDTVCAHGAAWAERYYLSKGMPAWEFGFWLRHITITK